MVVVYYAESRSWLTRDDGWNDTITLGFNE